MIRFLPDPTVLVQIGPFAIRFYALAYIVSLIIGWRTMRRLVRWTPAVANEQQTDDFLTWAALGVVLGGRLGYVLFYQPGFYLSHSLQALAVWEGGMSFHGGMLGVVTVVVVYCRKHAIPLFGFADRLAVVVPFGLGLGRLANFVNGELWGRPAPDGLPWGMVFARAGDAVPRHPSQLYEATMEGALLLAVMLSFARRERVRARFGLLTGIFLIGYSIARIIAEHFREPDRFLGPVLGDATMGQVLSTPMLLAGIGFVVYAQRRRPAIA